MPFFEYMLLAILGSAPTATVGTPSAIRTVTADDITQPAGGTIGDSSFTAGIGLIGQDTGGSTDSKVKAGTGKKPLEHRQARRYHKGRRHGKVTKTTKTRNAAKV